MRGAELTSRPSGGARGRGLRRHVLDHLRAVVNRDPVEIWGERRGISRGIEPNLRARRRSSASALQWESRGAGMAASSS